MPRFIVLQPNGKLAEFSTIVDHFTKLDFTKEEMIEDQSLCMSRQDAIEKVQRGILDLPVAGGQRTGPLHRWNECLETIKIVHGKRALAKFKREKH